MKLDRNKNLNGTGKYALIKLREIRGDLRDRRDVALNEFTIDGKAVDFGDTPDTDFFVIRLKDKYAFKALSAYAMAAAADESEYAQEILELAERAFNHPSKKKPD